MTKVNVIVQGSYAMPPVCVCCGAPAGVETISVGGSDFSGKHTVSLRFPICDGCAEARRATKTPRRRGHLLGFIGGFLVGMGVARIGYIIAPSDWWAVPGLAITVLGTILGARFFLRHTADETKARAAGLDSAVVFKKYRAPTFGTSNATIEFANDSFAYLFCTANPIVAMPAAEGTHPSVDLDLTEDQGTQVPPAGWYPDPSNRHERRWWDGSSWTENVDDGGVPSVDAVA